MTQSLTSKDRFKKCTLRDLVLGEVLERLTVELGYGVPKCDVIKFLFLNFIIFMTISVEHDEKPSHTTFYMNDESIHGGPIYDRMNTYLVPLNAV